MTKIVGLIDRVTVSDFHDRFRAMGRENQFSYEGRIALYEYLENLAEDTQEAIELDVNALCCDFTEYENIEAFKKEYDGYEAIEDIEQETTVIKIDDEAFIIQSF